jgi:hypothetical protein
MFEYMSAVFRAIGAALRMDPRLLTAVDTYPNAGWIVLGVVILAGASALLGQSVVLFVSRVTPQRFLLSLVLNGVVLVTTGITWAGILWLVGLFLFPTAPAFRTVLKLIGLSYAPLVFGFLVLMPYVGPAISRLLYAYTFLIATRAVQGTFQVDFWRAVLCVGLGFLVMLIMTNTIWRPVARFRNMYWQRLTGVRRDASTQDILTSIQTGNRSSTGKGGRA